jgi:hypothetical protein
MDKYTEDQLVDFKLTPTYQSVKSKDKNFYMLNLRYLTFDEL